jgi:hypothetical protein
MLGGERVAAATWSWLAPRSGPGYLHPRYPSSLSNSTIIFLCATCGSEMNSRRMNRFNPIIWVVSTTPRPNVANIKGGRVNLSQCLDCRTGESAQGQSAPSRFVAGTAGLAPPPCLAGDRGDKIVRDETPIRSSEDLASCQSAFIQKCSGRHSVFNFRGQSDSVLSCVPLEESVPARPIGSRRRQCPSSIRPSVA